MSETIDNGLVGNEWAGEQGRLWLANLAKFEGMIMPVGAALVKRAAFRPGENVLDLGCGGGPTTITIARCVSPGGSATGASAGVNARWRGTSPWSRAPVVTISVYSHVCREMKRCSERQ